MYISVSEFPDVMDPTISNKQNELVEMMIIFKGSN